MINWSRVGVTLFTCKEVIIKEDKRGGGVLCVEREPRKGLRGQIGIMTAVMNFHTSLLKCGSVTGRQARV